VYANISFGLCKYGIILSGLFLLVHFLVLVPGGFLRERENWRLQSGVVIALAAFVGKTRLIDNTVLA